MNITERQLILTGGFGGNTGHDPHITYTLYAVQCFALCNRLEECDKEGIANCETLDPFFFHLNLSDVVFYF